MKNYVDSLNSELIVSFTLEDSISSNMARLGLKSDAYISFRKGESDLNVFYKDNETPDQKTLIFLKKYDAILKNSIWRIKEPLESYRTMMDFTRKMVRIPTVLLASVWYSDGKFSGSMLFNKKNQEEVSSMLLETFPSSDGAKIEYLGSSGGFKAILSQMNARSKISVASIKMKPPKKETTGSNNPMGEKWTRIIKYPGYIDSIQCIYFQDDVDQGVKISETTTTNSFIQAFEFKAAEDRIPIMIRINTFEKNEFTYMIFFPSIFKDEIVRLIAYIYNEKSEWSPIMIHLQEYGDWVDGFL